MKCEVTSNKTHDVLISKEIIWKSYKEVCNEEPKKVNLGYWGNWFGFQVEDNSLVHIPRELTDNIRYLTSNMAYIWEVLDKFFSSQNIETNWLHCDYTTGWYWEGGLAVWERFEKMNIECDD